MPVSNPERLISLLQAFVSAPSWAETRCVVEENPELLSEESDWLLARLLETYRDDSRAVRVLTEHRDLLRRCREVGIEVAFAGLEDVDPEAALRELLERAESDPEARAALEAMTRQAAEHPLMKAINALMAARSSARVLEAVRVHPDLLSDQADAMLRGAVENARQAGDEGMARHIEERYQILRQIRERGIDPQMAAAAAQATAVLPEEVRQALAELVEGEGITSLEELEAALARHPELREELEAASRQAGAGPDWGGIPAAVMSILRELSRPARRADMPRRIELCRQALQQVDRDRNPGLWAALQVELANSLAQTPLGERAENLERAIGHYTQALEVYTRQADPERWAGTQNNLANAYRNRIRGERAENLERAIQCYQGALRVLTAEAFPHHHRIVVRNLEQALTERGESP